MKSQKVSMLQQEMLTSRGWCSLMTRSRPVCFVTGCVAVLGLRMLWVSCHALHAASQINTINGGNRFMYFSYGSNMLAARIHLRSPSAVFYDIATLGDHQLDFDYYSAVWHGAIATVVPTRAEIVWGIVWSVNTSDIPNLDDQEGVKHGLYKVTELDVETRGSGQRLRCRSYSLLKRGWTDRRPSPQYLDTIIRGAVEHDLPAYYVNQLRAIETNGYAGQLDIVSSIRSVKT